MHYEFLILSATPIIFLWIITFLTLELGHRRNRETPPTQERPDPTQRPYGTTRPDSRSPADHRLDTGTGKHADQARYANADMQTQICKLTNKICHR